LNTAEINNLTVNETILVPEIYDRDNVKYYGAVGDGVTDDTAAFVAALAATQCLEIPGGTYILSSTLVIPTGTTMKGCARGTVLKSSADVILQVQAATSILSVQLVYSGSNYTTSIGIKSDSTNNIFNSVLMNLGAGQYPAIGFQFNNGLNFAVNCYIVGVLIGVDANLDQASVVNCLIYSNAVCVSLSGTDYTLVGNTFAGDGSTTGVDFGSSTECYAVANTFNATISTLYANKSATTITTDNAGRIDVGGSYQVDQVQVVTNRQTGYDVTFVGANPATAINATTITATDGNIQALSSVVNAIKSSLITHGLIGA